MTLCPLPSLSTAGAATYGMDGAVNLPAAAIMAAAATVTAGFGARFTARLNGPRLQQVLGLFMLTMAPMVSLKPYLITMAKNGEQEDDGGGNSAAYADTHEQKSFMEKQTEAASKMQLHEVVAYGTIGLATGFVSGLFGIGGGSIMTPSLALLTSLSQHAVIGTSLASMVIPSVAGAQAHYQMGNIVTKAVVPILVGTASGAYLGSRFGLSLPEEQLRWFFGALMLVLGGRQFAQATRKLRQPLPK